MKNDCIFCKIINGDIPCFKVFEDNQTLAFMDINPVSEGHALVIPKRHSANAFEIEDEDIAAVAGTARRVARAINVVLQPEGMNLVQCNGPAAQQSVLHFHMHVLPRAMNDNVPLNWELNAGDMQAIGELAERIGAVVGQ